MAAKYAEGTDVPVEKTRMEIERVLRKYGADQFVSGYEPHRAAIMFVLRKRHVRFDIAIPDSSDKQFHYTGRGVWRTQAQRENAAQAEERRLWRVLLLTLKAKLEAVDAGLMPFDQEFLAHIVLPSGQTTFEWLGPQIENAYSGGEMPALLPGTSR